MCGGSGNNNPFKNLGNLFWVLVLCFLIFYQIILTFIFPFRWHIFILLLEISILFFLLYRIIWPY